jgi:protein-tyrosine phosphatase
MTGGAVEKIKTCIAAVGNARDRIAHPKRHADARRRLEQIGEPKTILVVCAGNMCRSPYLEAVLKRDVPGVNTSSAGFFGGDRPVPPHALEVSAKRGLDLSTFRSATIQPRVARAADVVIVMDQEQATYLARYMGVPRGRIIVAGDLDSEGPGTRAIEDPWQKPIEVFESTFDRLERCAATLVAIVRAVGQSQFRNSTVPPSTSHSDHASASVTVRVPRLTI